MKHKMLEQILMLEINYKKCYPVIESNKNYVFMEKIINKNVIQINVWTCRFQKNSF